MESIECEYSQLQTQNKNNLLRIKDLERKNSEHINEKIKLAKKAEINVGSFLKI